MAISPSKWNPIYDEVKIPTDEEEAELRRRLVAGDESARQELIIGTIPFAMREAGKYVEGAKAVKADIMQEAMFGLTKAAHRFDPERETKFITYAGWWIHQAIKKSLCELDIVHVPAYMRKQLVDLAREAQGCIVDPEGLRDLNQVAQTEHQRAGIQALREHTSFGDKAKDVFTVEIDYDEKLLSDETKEQVEHYLFCLPDRIATILRMRFGIGYEKPMSLQQVSDQIGLSRERIRQLQNRGIKILQDVLKEVE